MRAARAPEAVRPPSRFSTSDMSLLAASSTKSAMVGLMPSVGLTPAFSPTDCANADVETSSAAATIVGGILSKSRLLTLVGPRKFVMQMSQCNPTEGPGFQQTCFLRKAAVGSIALADGFTTDRERVGRNPDRYPKTTCDQPERC